MLEPEKPGQEKPTDQRQQGQDEKPGFGPGQAPDQPGLDPKQVPAKE